MSSDPDSLRIESGSTLQGKTTVPGDKSISHRAVMFGALADGVSQVRGWLPAGDTRATLEAIRALGVAVEEHDATTLTIRGGKLQPPDTPLNLVNAGTGMRLLAGILAGQPFSSIIDGSDQLRLRPMSRITDPLEMMGADITSTNGCAPLHIRPADLRGIRYDMPVASAQVKSAVLLAGLFADGATTVVEPGPTRDHTERLLQAMGADIQVNGDVITLKPDSLLQPLDMTVPGDFSSAAFLLVAASLLPGKIVIDNVSLNPTRAGLLDVLRTMGAAITVTPTGESGGDPVGRLVVQSTELGSALVSGDTVVRMIDEFPILMVAALCAQGETIVRDARELRVKETDRIAVMSNELRKMGAVIEEREDGFVIIGPQRLRGATLDGHEDHRVAMSLAVAGLVAEGNTTVHDAACIADSFPGFTATLQHLGGKVSEHH